MNPTNNNYYNEISVDINYISKVINRSMSMSGEIVSILNLLPILFTRYYFKYPIIYFDTEHKEYLKVPNISSFLIDTTKQYVICIDLHKQILLTTLEEYNKYKHSIDYTDINSLNINELIKSIDEKITRIPVIYYLSFRDKNQVMKILHDKIIFVYESTDYLVSREVLDMLYAETQDFIFTEDQTSKIIVKTDARHKLCFGDDYLCELLKDDLAIIIDTQDKLKDEYDTTQIPYSYHISELSKLDYPCNDQSFKFDSEEFQK